MEFHGCSAHPAELRSTKGALRNQQRSISSRRQRLTRLGLQDLEQGVQSTLEHQNNSTLKTSDLRKVFVEYARVVFIYGFRITSTCSGGSKMWQRPSTPEQPRSIIRLLVTVQVPTALARLVLLLQLPLLF